MGTGLRVVSLATQCLVSFLPAAKTAIPCIPDAAIAPTAHLQRAADSCGQVAQVPGFDRSRHWCRGSESFSSAFSSSINFSQTARCSRNVEPAALNGTAPRAVDQRSQQSRSALPIAPTNDKEESTHHRKRLPAGRKLTQSCLRHLQDLLQVALLPQTSRSSQSNTGRLPRPARNIPNL